MKPASGDFNPKNIIDHSILRINCITNITSAILTFLLCNPFLHTRNNAIPISKNRVVQTGANTALGGVKDGLFSVAYQVGIAGVVKKEPIKPDN